MNKPGPVPDAVRPLPMGELIGREQGRRDGRSHRILSKLGHGGFGITYKAEAPSGDIVAIKEFFPVEAVQRDGKELIIRPGEADNFAAAHRYFREEAETLRALSEDNPHPNIVGVRGLFEKHNTSYMVMDFIDGDQLAHRLRNGPQFNDAALTDLLGEMTVALGHLHEAGVLHMDIKPANIMIRRATDKPVLIDFGAARNQGQIRDPIEIYTEAYAPVEVIDPNLRPLGPWSDIYSLGVVAYMAATGRKPPRAQDRVDALNRNGRDSLIPCMQAKRTDISHRLGAVIDACLALVPRERPVSAEELLHLLRGNARRPAPTKRYGTPRNVPLEQITRSVKIMHVIQLTPPRRSDSLGQSMAEPVAGTAHEGRVPLDGGGFSDPEPKAAPRPAVRSGDATTILLGVVLAALVGLIGYLLLGLSF